MKALLLAAQLVAPGAETVELPWALHGGQIVRTEDGCIAFELDVAGRTDPPLSAFPDPPFEGFFEARLRMTIGTRKHDGSSMPATFSLVTADPLGFTRSYLLEVRNSTFRLAPSGGWNRLVPPEGSRAPFLIWASDGFRIRYRTAKLQVDYDSFGLVKQNIRLGCLTGVFDDCDCARKAKE